MGPPAAGCGATLLSLTLAPRGRPVDAQPVLLLFERLPTWRLGLYGGPQTPAFDGAAARGRIFDAAFASGASPDVDGAVDVRRHPGCTADLSQLRPSDPGRLNVLTPPEVWDELLTAWQDDGFEVGEDVQAADVPDLLSEDPSILSDDLRWDVDAAATFAGLLETLAVEDAGRWLEEQLRQLASANVVITAAAGGSPLPRSGETLLDVDRHVPLIHVDGSAGRREGRLVDASRPLEPTPRPTLTWRDDTGHAIRRPDLLATFGTGAERPRIFLKPDDRFCQLDVAPQRPDLVASLSPAADEQPVDVLDRSV